jgi:hypothetical protein
MKRMIKTKNNIWAICAAPAATPENPNNAAMIAMMKKTAVQYSMIFPPEKIRKEQTRQPGQAKAPAKR